MLRSRKYSVPLHLLFFTGLVLLFLGGPGDNPARSLRELWNLGHLFLFVIFVFILYSDWNRFAEKPAAAQFIIAVASGVILGFGTELIQSFVGREFDKIDILRDLAGCATGVLIISGLRSRSNRACRIFCTVSASAIIIAASVPLMLAAADELIAAGQFPKLSGFETPLEIRRWRADGDISVSEEFKKEGSRSLKAQFTPRKYSRVTMRYSLGEWEGYDYIQFCAFNPDSSVLDIIFRIHDSEHQRRDSPYRDRFHRKLEIMPGWNTVRVGMDEIESAPADRDMDLNSIEQITFFTVSLPNSRIIYFDDISLGRNQQ
jgi:hypothetical protein